MRYVLIILLFSGCLNYHLGMNRAAFERKIYKSGLNITHPYHDTYIYKHDKETDTFIFKNDSLNAVYFKEK